MKGNLARRKGINDVSYVDLRPAGDTNMKFWNMVLDKLSDELEDPFAR